MKPNEIEVYPWVISVKAKTGEPLYWNGNPMYSLVSFGPMKDACGWTKKKDAEVAWRTGACEKHYPDAAIMNAHTHEHSDGKRVIQRVMPDLSVYYLADVSLSSSCRKLSWTPDINRAHHVTDFHHATAWIDKHFSKDHCVEVITVDQEVISEHDFH